LAFDSHWLKISVYCDWFMESGIIPCYCAPVTQPLIQLIQVQLY